MSIKKDLLIAEEIMGWSWFKDPDNFKPGNWYDDKDKEPVADHAFSPSSNIKDAWKLIEYLQQCDWNIVLYAQNRQSAVMFRDNIHIQRFADTMPLAICETALEAYGVKT